MDFCFSGADKIKVVPTPKETATAASNAAEIEDVPAEGPEAEDDNAGKAIDSEGDGKSKIGAALSKPVTPTVTAAESEQLPIATDSIEFTFEQAMNSCNEVMDRSKAAA